MAGFLDNIGLGGLKSRLSDLSRVGMKYEDLLIKNSQSIGFIESQLMQARGNVLAGGQQDSLARATMAISDTTSALRTKAIAFFQLDYATKRERLRDLASNGEIEFVIESITDDVIVFDEDNRFAYPNDLVGEMLYKGKNKEQRLKYQEKVIEKYNENFERIYNAWGFNEGISAWQYFYQWLIEGHLAFEILYDDLQNPREIIGFKEIDPSTLYPQIKKDAAGKIFLEWAQKVAGESKVRTLTDSQVLYLSYSNHFRTKRISFVERMVRSFNLMRVIEHSKVIWHTMNAPIRLTTKVPIGSKSLNKAKEDVREFANQLKEDIFFDTNTGEIQVDGRPNLLFYKNYILPVNDQNQAIEIAPLEYAGPNMSGSELLNYFKEKLKMDSKIPYSRWDSANGAGQYTMNAEGIRREEIRYNKFITRLRSAFKELLTKPLYLQMCLDFKDLKDDYRFKNAVGINWHDDNVFEEIKQQDLLNKRLATLNALKGVVDDEGKPYFSTEYLVKEYLRMSDEDLQKNKDYMNQTPTGEGEEGAAAEPGSAPEAGAAPEGGAAAEPAAGKETATELGAPGAL
jgi:hypothetical protein